MSKAAEDIFKPLLCISPLQWGHRPCGGRKLCPGEFHYSRLEGDPADRCVVTDKGKLNRGGGAGIGGRRWGEWRWGLNWFYHWWKLTTPQNSYYMSGNI